MGIAHALSYGSGGIGGGVPPAAQVETQRPVGRHHGIPFMEGEEKETKSRSKRAREGGWMREG